MIADEDKAGGPRPIWPELGGDLARLSIRDLTDYVAALEAEIGRVRADLAAKQGAIGGAEALFRR
ncbi:MAG: DUF1192 domain-containing protein [Alphaproteobacteria bacterium]|nr:DUF1192 domain-containing protein [Alphaproteobacteria bacterium]